MLFNYENKYFQKSQFSDLKMFLTDYKSTKGEKHMQGFDYPYFAYPYLATVVGYPY